MYTNVCIIYTEYSRYYYSGFCKQHNDLLIVFFLFCIFNFFKWNAVKILLYFICTSKQIQVFNEPQDR